MGYADYETLCIKCKKHRAKLLPIRNDGDRMYRCSGQECNALFASHTSYSSCKKMGIIEKDLEKWNTCNFCSVYRVAKLTVPDISKWVCPNWIKRLTNDDVYQMGYFEKIKVKHYQKERKEGGLDVREIANTSDRSGKVGKEHSESSE